MSKKQKSLASQIMKERWKDPEWRKMMSERVSRANKKTRTGKKKEAKKQKEKFQKL